MKKTIYFLIFVLLVGLVSAVTIELGTEYEPSNGGSFYVLADFEANELTVNSDGLIINLSANEDLRLKNNGTEGNLTVNNLGSFNQVFINNQTIPLIENVGEFDLTFHSGNRSFVFSYITASQPKFSSIPLTVTDMTYSFNSSAKLLTLVCTGTGAMTISNLNSVKGDDGRYIVRRNGVTQTTTNTDSYTTSGCSTWTFTPSATVVSNTMDDIINQLKKVIPWIGIILIVALASIILLMVKGEVEPEDGMKGISAIVLAVIAIAVILTVSILLLTELGAV